MKTTTASSITVKKDLSNGEALPDIAVSEMKGDFTLIAIDRIDAIEHVALVKGDNGYIHIYQKWDTEEAYTLRGRSTKKTLKAEVRQWEKVQRIHLQQALKELVS